MTDLLFPLTEARLKVQRRGQYAALLTDIVRSASDAMEALSTFRVALYDCYSGRDNGSLIKFDAQGGETGCHLRAGMFLEAYVVHRAMMKDSLTREPLVPIWIDKTVQRLQSTRTKAQDICLALTRDNKNPQLFGLGWKDVEISQALVAVEWEELSLSYSPFDLYETQYGVAESDSNDELSSFDDNLNTSSSSSSSSLSSDPSGSTMSSNEETDVPSPFNTRWDLYDSRVLLRLLVYCFVLSKYKSFCCLANKSVTARLCPEAAAEEGNRLMKDYWHPRNSQYRRSSGLERFNQELRVLQGWVSDLSCSWLHCLATRWDLYGMAKIIAETARKSSTGLTVAPCYLGYLLIRREWALRSTNLLLVDRFFCSQGWHFNVAVAHISFKQNESPIEIDLQSGIEWRIQPLTMEDLRSSEWSSQVLPTIMGNSISGSSDDYMARMVSTENREYHTCDSESCNENNEHVDAFNNADHDRIALAFFASHKSYPFQVEKKDENELIAEYLDGIDPGMRKKWDAIAGELGSQGGGRERMDIFGWQHFFIDFPKNVGSRLEEWMKAGNLLPLAG